MAMFCARWKVTSICLHPQKPTGIPKMMVWQRWIPSKRWQFLVSMLDFWSVHPVFFFSVIFLWKEHEGGALTRNSLHDFWGGIYVFSTSYVSALFPNSPLNTKKGATRWAPTYTRWWFQISFIFTPTWRNDPIWLIFFRWVETTN